MATDIGDDDKVNIFKEIREIIEEKFDCIIQRATERRDALLEQLAEWERGSEAMIEGFEDLKSSKQEIEQVYSTITSETAKESLMKSIDELTVQIDEIDKIFSESSFVCETNDIEWRISQLGVLCKSGTRDVTVRDYKSIQKPLNSFEKIGSGKDKFEHPRGVLVDEDNSRIFVTDHNHRIQICSMDVYFLSEFGTNILNRPWEIVLHNKRLYISDFSTHSITKWCSDTFSFIAVSKATQGYKQGQLCKPAGLDVDCGEIFVVEYRNKRVSVFDLNLCFKRVMAVGKLNNSYCLRIRSNTIYVVEQTGVIKLFSKANQHLRTIDKSDTISNYVYHFNLDSSLNFLITDIGINCLIILSPDGELIHSICFDTWGVNQPFGIDVTRKGKLVVSFQEGNSPVVIF